MPKYLGEYFKPLTTYIYLGNRSRSSNLPFWLVIMIAGYKRISTGVNVPVGRDPQRCNTFEYFERIVYRSEIYKFTSHICERVWEMTRLACWPLGQPLQLSIFRRSFCNSNPLWDTVGQHRPSQIQSFSARDINWSRNV